jgi:hypothetical protein
MRERLRIYASRAGALVCFDETKLDLDGGVSRGAVRFSFEADGLDGKDMIERDAEVTGRQAQGLQRIAAEEQRHAQALEQISATLAKMNQIVGEVTAEGERQDLLIEDLERAMQRTEDALVDVNGTLKETLGEVGGGPENFCFAFFCCFIASMLLMIIFNGLARRADKG